MGLAKLAALLFFKWFKSGTGGTLKVPGATTFEGDVTLTGGANALTVGDDSEVVLGTDGNWKLRYDEAGVDSLMLSEATVDTLAIKGSAITNFAAATDTAGNNIFMELQQGGVDGGVASAGQNGANLFFNGGAGSNAVTANAAGGTAGGFSFAGGAGGNGQGSGNGGDGGTIQFLGGDGGADGGTGTDGDGGDILVIPGLKAGTGSDGKLIVRQPGGVAGTDELQLYDDGTNSNIGTPQTTLNLWVSSSSTKPLVLSATNLKHGNGDGGTTLGQTTRAFGASYLAAIGASSGNQLGFMAPAGSNTASALFLKASSDSISSFAAASDTAAYTSYFRSQTGGTATAGNGRAGGTFDFTAGAGSAAFAGGAGNGGAGGTFKWTLGAGGAKDGAGTDGAAGNFDIYPPAPTGSGAVGALRIFEEGSTTEHVRIKKGPFDAHFDVIDSSNEGLLFRFGSAGSNAIVYMDNSSTYNTGKANVAIQAAGFWTSSDYRADKSLLTSGTMTLASANTSLVRQTVHKFTWTNAMVTALGAVTSGDILVCTLPAKTKVVNAYMVVDTAEGALTSLTGAVGRTGATYIDYIVASSLKAAANTVYGDGSAERGTNLTGYDLPSYTGTTAVYLHLVSGVENLSTATTCTGTVIIETALIP